MEKTVKTICPYCGVGCGLTVKVRDGTITEVRGDKSNPSSLGGICPKGAQIRSAWTAPCLTLRCVFAK
jgi:anaerobic selenocysteine-containing dehydrogenase